MASIAARCDQERVFSRMSEGPLSSPVLGAARVATLEQPHGLTLQRLTHEPVYEEGFAAISCMPAKSTFTYQRFVW